MSLFIYPDVLFMLNWTYKGVLIRAWVNTDCKMGLMSLNPFEIYSRVIKKVPSKVHLVDAMFHFMKYNKNQKKIRQSKNGFLKKSCNKFVVFLEYLGCCCAFYRENALEESATRKWFSHFKETHFDMTDSARPGSPSDFDTDRSNVLINDDPYNRL